MSRAVLNLLILCSVPGISLRAQEVPSWSASVGGEVRERLESVRNPAFGLRAPASNDYFLSRAVLFGQVRYEDALLMRLEVVSGLTSGWNGAPPPTQDDALDVSQAYIASSFRVEQGQVELQVGRQALALGSSRLVSIRESPNVRRAFDGVNASWTEGDGRRVTAFYVRPVVPRRGVLDDANATGQRFWGVYATLPVASISGLHSDVYYFSLERDAATFATGSAREHRRTVGARVFGARQAWDWDVEGVRQWGAFGSTRIRAWTLSMDLGFELTSLPLSPRLGLKVDAISGDRDPSDRVLGTFNALFPKLPYFSEANLATPANLLDIQPNVRLEILHGLHARLSWNGLWKYAAADAYYTPPLEPVEGTSRTHGRDIGWQASASIEWRATTQVEIAAVHVIFDPGSVPRQAGGRGGRFFGAWIQWTF